MGFNYKREVEKRGEKGERERGESEREEEGKRGREEERKRKTEKRDFSLPDPH